MFGNKSIGAENKLFKLGARTWWEIPAHQSRWVSYHFTLIENPNEESVNILSEARTKQVQKSHFAATWPDLAQ